MEDTQSTIDDDEHHQAPKLDLSGLPSIYVLGAHLSITEQHEAEDALGESLTYDIREANIVIGIISKSRRAKLELQWKGVHVEDIKDVDKGDSPLSPEGRSPARKSRKLGNENENVPRQKVDVIVDDSTTASETEDESSPKSMPSKRAAPPLNLSRDKVIVIRLEWLNDSLSTGKVLPLEPYTVYTGRLVPLKAPAANASAIVKADGSKSVMGNKNSDIKGGSSHETERVYAKTIPSVNRYIKRDRIKDAADKDFVGRSFSSSTQAASSQRSSQHITRPTHLLHQTTSEHDEAASSALPPLPDWVQENKIYACERATPLVSPNQAFICQLKKIKLARLLTLDEIGVRAYSSSIAALAAYPYRLQSTREILALPSCDQKIAHLFHEFQTSNGKLGAVAEIEADPVLKILGEFYEIFGVGAKTAREFYYDKGWRDLDDIIEHGWKSLSRVQQIGLKYYDEFMVKIARVEVESIAATITKHACLVADEGIKSIIVGGYRRMKAESGDVDIILSHRDEAMTYNLVDRVVRSLEKEGWITHTLTLNLTNTKRNQETLPINTATLGGHGFDTLDKALVVWQDPNWPTKAADLEANPKAKNPNLHRRVDIIVSPWRTIGCGVAGWTSGTTFQRDLRRYAKYVKGWKFDSSGVRQRGTGRWVDLEGWRDTKTRCRDWKEAERRVFEGMGLVYREPWDRCTG